MLGFARYFARGKLGDRKPRKGYRSRVTSCGWPTCTLLALDPRNPHSRFEVLGLESVECIDESNPEAPWTFATGMFRGEFFDDVRHDYCRNSSCQGIWIHG